MTEHREHETMESKESDNLLFLNAELFRKFDNTGECGVMIKKEGHLSSIVV